MNSIECTENFAGNLGANYVYNSALKTVTRKHVVICVRQSLQ